MASKGWIKLHRQLLDSGIWELDEPFDERSAWIDLLLMANHEDREIFVNKEPLLVQSGQKFTSIRKLSERWQWSKDKTNRYIKMLVSAGMLTKSATHNGTLLTIENYSKFQSQCDTKRDTDKDTVGTSSRTRSSHKQELKNNKNEKNERIDGPPARLVDAWGREYE